jgi:uncharacterized RDD family membrane protein YckC
MEAPEYSLNGPFPLAGFWIRIFSRLGIAFPAFFILLPYSVTQSLVVSVPLGLLLGILVDSFIGSKIGASLGEFIFMLKVVDIRTGEKASFTQHFRRNLFLYVQSLVFSLIFGLLAFIIYKIIGFNFIRFFQTFGLNLPFLVMLGSPYKQALYDLSAGVIVVNTSPYYHPRYPLQILPQE